MSRRNMRAALHGPDLYHALKDLMDEYFGTLEPAEQERRIYAAHKVLGVVEEGETA